MPTPSGVDCCNPVPAYLWSVVEVCGRDGQNPEPESD